MDGVAVVSPSSNEPVLHEKPGSDSKAGQVGGISPQRRGERRREDENDVSATSAPAVRVADSNGSPEPESEPQPGFSAQAPDSFILALPVAVAPFALSANPHCLVSRFAQSPRASNRCLSSVRHWNAVVG